MPVWMGDIDAFVDGRIRGWVFDTRNPARTVDLAIVIDGGEPLFIRANLSRSDLTGGLNRIGNHGFDVDISEALTDRTQDLSVRIVMEDGADLRGSPLRFTVPAEAMLESTGSGMLIGWAFGVWYTPVDVEVWHDGRLLLSWPAHDARDDVRAAGIGSGRHGFSIPLQQLLSPVTGAQFTLRVPGSDIALPFELPAGVQPKPSLSRAIQDSIPNAQQFATELLAATNSALEPDADQPAHVMLSFDIMQALLDRIALLRSKIDTYKSLYTIGEHTRAQRRAFHRPAPHPAHDALERVAKSRDSKSLVDHIDKIFLPAYAATDRELRSGIHDLLSLSTDRFALRHLAKQARKFDHLQLADVSYATQLALSDQPSMANLQHAEKLKSWAALCRNGKLVVPRQQVVPVRRHSRTLYVLWRSIPYDTNGYATRSHYLLRALAEMGNDVVACTRLGYPWDAEKRCSPAGLMESIDGVTYFHLGSSDVNRQSLTLEAYIDECALRLAQVALTTGADLIHSASNWIAALPALKAARMTGLPFCYEMRGLWEVTRASTNAGYDCSDHFSLFSDMETRVASASDLVFAITSGLKSELERRGYNGSPIEIAPNGVDLERFSPVQYEEQLAQELGIGNECVFGFIGSFVAYEGLAMLCEAAARLKQKKLPFKVLLVGDGPAFASVKAEVQRLALGDVVIITGRVPFEAVPRYYSLINVAIFPRLATQITEMVSPLKPFEAMAMEKPVIGSNVRAIAEIVRHGETGWLFEKNNLDSLCATMSNVIAQRAEAERLGKAARAYVERCHSWSNIAAEMAMKWDRLRSLRSGSVGGHPLVAV